ncbi:MAG: inositol monophosphatase [Rhodospirillaceae bacterium]|jgi:myo-inositol-1(or 4)-monophosphatase|nr:inositol monophosphatase [Rhodospirillaceae bacterium]MBT4220170.1 inositol monophosphatase [Rhodospirillaceae bacterium]MBT5307817.1 inositol monophosphatase [Rhodospirillaceae bacterium]MBT6407559.1 inositol monophosphatase [Rhodospirillaceae bacterium]MBT7355988.1 inositol monophosphatase [Rhodospirillaceae bacterium]
MAQRSALINVMIAAAQKAARKLTRDFGEIENLQVSRKGPADFVSNADKTAENTLRYALEKARPDYCFLLEEGGELTRKDTSNRWIIDPLDGTTNFLHGIPHFSISIALERDSELFAGVVYEPVYDQMYWAEKGQGAYLNDNRIRVSGRSSMDEALFATGIPFKGARDHPLFLKQLEAVMGVSSGVRRFGSAALDLAYVATGRFDGFWETGLQPWDIAAGIVLVREAGGFISEIDGRSGMLTSGSVLAANDQLHTPLGKLLRESVK